MLKKIIRSTTGSALLNVALAVGAMGGMAALMMRSSENSNKAMKSNFLTEDMRDLTSQIGRLLSSSEACLATFTGQSATSSSDITSIKDHTGAEVLSNNTKFGTGPVGFESVYLKDPGDPADDVQVTTGASGSTYAMVKFKKVQGSLFSERNQVYKIRLSVVTDATGKVTRCFSANSSDSLWTREAPSDNINYSPGNVGIGITTPTEKMDVSGSSFATPGELAVAATTTDGDKISLGGTATEYRLNVNEAKPIVFKQVTTATKATAIVNKATAEQSLILKPVEPSPSGVACSPALEGAMRSKEIFIRNQAHGQSALTLLRTQVCSDFGGVWKWRTIKLQKYTRATGAPCTPGVSQKDCTDHSTANQ